LRVVLSFAVREYSPFLPLLFVRFFRAPPAGSSYVFYWKLPPRFFSSPALCHSFISFLFFVEVRPPKQTLRPQPLHCLSVALIFPSPRTPPSHHPCVVIALFSSPLSFFQLSLSPASFPFSLFRQRWIARFCPFFLKHQLTFSLLPNLFPVSPLHLSGPIPSSSHRPLIRVPRQRYIFSTPPPLDPTREASSLHPPSVFTDNKESPYSTSN